MTRDDTEALRAMEASYQASKAAYEQAIVAREAIIRSYHSRGLTVREIAGAVGCHPSLVGRITGRNRSLAA